MTDQELRALVREAVHRHLGAQPTTSPAPTVPSTAPVHAVSVATSHPSHELYISLVNADDACVIEPTVKCDHCRYCKSHGH